MLPVAKRTIAIDVADGQPGLSERLDHASRQLRRDLRRISVRNIRQNFDAGKTGVA